MKLNYLIPSFFFAIIPLTNCSGSDVYQGNWKATDTEGKKYEINFEPNNITIKDESGNAEKFEYTQNSVKIENSVKSYGIQLGDGRIYSILFPIADETSKGVISLENEEPLYTISRTSYIQYKDLYKLGK
jgi:predicted phosphoadenosine phosphosulfate sulfurtransferase